MCRLLQLTKLTSQCEYQEDTVMNFACFSVHKPKKSRNKQKQTENKHCSKIIAKCLKFWDSDLVIRTGVWHPWARVTVTNCSIRWYLDHTEVAQVGQLPRDATAIPAIATRFDVSREHGRDSRRKPVILGEPDKAVESPHFAKEEQDQHCQSNRMTSRRPFYNSLIKPPTQKITATISNMAQQT